MSNYMYAIDRNDEYLAHYGVKGMKWGVRKLANAIASKNSRRAERAIRRAQRKLARMEKRGTAEARGRYARRAALLGAGAAAAGGLAVAGTEGVSNAMRGVGNVATKGMNRISQGMYRLGGAMEKAHIRGGTRLKNAGTAALRASTGLATATGRGASALSKWGNSPFKRVTAKSNYLNALADSQSKQAAAALASGNTKALQKYAQAAKNNRAAAENAMMLKFDTPKSKYLSSSSQTRAAAENAKGVVTNNMLARAGAGLVGAGLAGAAGYNAYRAATTKRAARKAAEYRQQLNQAVRGTQYANAFGGGKSGSRKRKRNRG